jgi:hypothetical protein
MSRQSADETAVRGLHLLTRGSLPVGPLTMRQVQAP